MKNRLIFSRFTIFIIFLFDLSYICSCEHVKKSIDPDNREDESYEKEESLDISVPESEQSNITMCTRRKDSQVHEIRNAFPNQFPFVAAIMSPRNEYVCAGTVVSNGLILTSALCTESISYVLINTTNDKKDDGTVALHIIKSEKFPTHKVKDVAVIYTEKHNNTIATKINLSNYTSSSTLNSMEVLGFGLNAEIGQTKELQYVGLDARLLTDEAIKGFIDCIDTKVLTCFKDKGGPVIVNNELVGIVTTGQDECTGEIMSSYAINKRMVDVLPSYTFKAWLDEKIRNIELKDEELLETYPMKPVLREAVHVMTSAGKLINFSMLIEIILCSILYLF